MKCSRSDRKLAKETGKNPMIKEEHIYSARKGSPAKEVKVYDCAGKARDRP